MLFRKNHNFIGIGGNTTEFQRNHENSMEELEQASLHNSDNTELLQILWHLFDAHLSNRVESAVRSVTSRTGSVARETVAALSRKVTRIAVMYQAKCHEITRGLHQKPIDNMPNLYGKSNATIN